MNPYENMPEHVKRAAERAATMRRDAERTWKAATRAVDRVRREFDAHKALAARRVP